jgi:hypothetical protein
MLQSCLNARIAIAGALAREDAGPPDIVLA